MNKTRIVKHRRIGALLGTAAILFAVLLPRLAFAANAIGPVTHTEYFYFTYQGADGGTVAQPQLLLQLNGNSGVNYYAQQVTPGCGVPAVDIDTIKIWVSLAQAAELSGKNAQVYFNTCNGLSYIYDVLILN